MVFLAVTWVFAYSIKHHFAARPHLSLASPSTGSSFFSAVFSIRKSPNKPNFLLWSSTYVGVKKDFIRAQAVLTFSPRDRSEGCAFASVLSGRGSTKRRRGKCCFRVVSLSFLPWLQFLFLYWFVRLGNIFIGVLSKLCRSAALGGLIRFFEERTARWSDGYEVGRRLRIHARFENKRVLSLMRFLFKAGKVYAFPKTSF